MFTNTNISNDIGNLYLSGLMVDAFKEISQRKLHDSNRKSKRNMIKDLVQSKVCVQKKNNYNKNSIKNNDMFFKHDQPISIKSLRLSFGSCVTD